MTTEKAGPQEWLTEVMTYMLAQARAIVKGRDAVQDVVQEAARKCWEKRDTFRMGTKRSYRAWCCATTRRVAYDYLNEEARRRQLAEDFARSCRPPRPPDRLHRHDRAVIRDAIWRLPATLRTIALLRYCLELDLPTIARLLALKGATARKRVSRAREALRRDPVIRELGDLP